MEDLVTECLQLMDNDQVDALRKLLEEGQVTTEVALDSNSPAQSLLLAAVVKRRPESVTLLMKHHPDLTVLQPDDSCDDDDDDDYDEDDNVNNDLYEKINSLPIQAILSWPDMTDLAVLFEPEDLAELTALPVEEVNAQCVALKLIYAEQYLALHCLLILETFEETAMQELLCEAITRTGSKMVVKELLKSMKALAKHTHDGVNVLAEYTHNSTLLYKAACLPNDDIFRLFIRYGAYVERYNIMHDSVVHSGDSKGNSYHGSSRFMDPLMYALSNSSPRAAVRLLTAHVNGNSQQLPTLKRYMKRMMQREVYLVYALYTNITYNSSHKSDYEKAFATNQTIGVIKELIANGCDINYQHQYQGNKTTLQLACCFQQHDIVRFLIESYSLSNDASKIHGNKAIINYGLIVLHDLYENCDIQTLTLSLSFDIQLLLAAEAPRSHLLAAVQYNRIDICQLLILNGFDVNVPGLLATAIRFGVNNNILALLLSSGADPNLLDEKGDPCIKSWPNDRPMPSDHLFGMIIFLLCYRKRFSQGELSKLLHMDRGMGVWIVLLEEGAAYLDPSNRGKCR